MLEDVNNAMKVRADVGPNAVLRAPGLGITCLGLHRIRWIVLNFSRLILRSRLLYAVLRIIIRLISTFFPGFGAVGLQAH